MEHIDFVGCMLSLDCGETLGTFQGEVTEVNKDKQTISLKKTYRNGVKYEVPEIIVRAVDIRDLKILKAFDEQDDVSGKTSKSTKETIQRNGTTNNCNSIPSSKQNKPQHNGGQRTPKKQDRQAGHPTNNRTPTKRVDVPNHGSAGGKSELYSGSHNSAFQRVQKDEVKDQGSEEEREVQVNEDRGRRPRYNSGNFEPNQKVRSSPRKMEGGQKQRRGFGVNARNAECFSAPSESFLTPDFDFDKSRKSFNKAAILEEFASTMSSGEHKRRPKTIPHDEDIILDNIPTFVHDKGGGQVKCSSYTSESGVVVPAVSIDVVQRLFQAADKLGLTTEKRLEMGGVCIARMALHLIGGKNREQSQPSILVVCGPHLQGAQGINCARHLANHNTNVTLFIPNFAKMPDVLMTELRIFKETTGIHVTSMTDLPGEPLDLIISALDHSGDTLMSKQPWHKSIVSWVIDNKASVLSIDPTPDHSVRSKWSVMTALPLSYNNTNTGMLYLCDVGIPNKVFGTVGVDYVSPFKNKFVVLLHNP